MNAKDLYQSALAIAIDDVERLSSELADYRYSFVIEAFVVANLTAEMDKDAWTLLADVAQLMKCDQEEIVVLSHVAKYKLTGNTKHLDSIPLPNTNRWSGKLKEYIPRKWVESKRCFHGEIFLGLSNMENDLNSNIVYEGLCKITDSLRNGDRIKEKGVIVKYEKACEGERTSSYGLYRNDWEFVGSYSCTVRPKLENRIITALCDGIVYFEKTKRIAEDIFVDDVCESYLEVYVISPFDDYDSFKSWLDNR